MLADSTGEYARCDASPLRSATSSEIPRDCSHVADQGHACIASKRHQTNFEARFLELNVSYDVASDIYEGH